MRQAGLLGEAPEIRRKAGYVDPQRAFTAVVHEPATAQPSQRHRDVGPGHARHPGQLVVAERQRHRAPRSSAAAPRTQLAQRAHRAQADHQAAEPLLGPAVREHLDPVLRVGQPQAERAHQRFEGRPVLAQVVQERVQLDLDRLTGDQCTRRRIPGPRPRGAHAQYAEGLARLDRAQDDGPLMGRGGHDRHSSAAKEIDTIGRVVRLPQVGALGIPPDATQGPVVRQVIRGESGQGLAVEVVGEFRGVHIAMLYTK